MAEEDIKFSEQLFLSSYINELIERTGQSITTGQKQFEYVTKFDTTRKSISEILALLRGKSENLKISKLLTHQYAVLIPKIRIYRVEDEKEYEFVFQKNASYSQVSDISNILGTPKGNNCGITSFTFKLAGSNPVTAEKQIEANMELFFDSINSFSGGDYDGLKKAYLDADKDGRGLDHPSFSKFNSGNTTTNYWSLLFHPKLTKKNSDKYDIKKFLIKVVVGWEKIEQNLLNELFPEEIAKSINEEIEESNISMYLNLIGHEYSFNEDGTIKISLTYISNLESAFTSNKTDLLYGLQEKIEEYRNASLNNKQNTGLTFEQETNQLQFLKYIKDNKNNLDKLIAENPELKDQITKFSNVSDSDLNSLIEENQKSIDERTNILNNNILNLKLGQYQGITRAIFENGKFYKIKIDQNTLQDWINWKNNLIKTKPKLVNTTTINQDPASTEASQAKAKVEAKAKQVENSDKPLSQLGEEPDKQPDFLNTKTIVFTTIGSIVEAVFLRTIERIDNKYKRTKNQEDKIDLENFKRNKIIFSCFYDEPYVGKNGLPVPLNIADIPISVETLTDFLVSNISETQRKNYSLQSFIKDVFNNLVEEALNSRDSTNDEIDKYSNTSIALNVITLQGKSDPLNKFKLSNNFVNFSSINKKDLKDNFIFTKIKDGYKPYNYFIVYDKYLKDFKGNGDVIKDEKSGIYHFTVGQNYGLVKSINFRRADQPNLRESKAIGKKNFFLGQFREIYHADVEMVGNNIFTPGMLIFLKPSVEMENPTSTNSFSQITGVGGYYTIIKVINKISDNDFTTSLECLWHSNGTSPTATRTDNKKTNSKLESERAGLISSDGTPTITSSQIEQILKASDKEKEERTKKENEALTKYENQYDGYSSASGGRRER